MENLPPMGLNLPPIPKSIPGYPQLNPVSVYAPFEHPPVEENDSIWQKILNSLTSPKLMDIMLGLVLIVLLVPSSMAVASWNAVPGDFTYTWKISLEKALLQVLRPSKELSSNTQVAITQRRFSEATRLLTSNQAGVGLVNLTDQVTTTSESIKGVTSQTAKKELTDKYIADLIEVNKKLEQEKQARKARRLAQTGQKTSDSPRTNNSLPVTQPDQPSYPAPTSGAQPVENEEEPIVDEETDEEDVDEEIDDAQEIIEETIRELETLGPQNMIAPEAVVAPSVIPTAAPTSIPTLVPTQATLQDQGANMASPNAAAKNSSPAESNAANKIVADEDKKAETEESEVVESESEKNLEAEASN